MGWLLGKALPMWVGIQHLSAFVFLRFIMPSSATTAFPVFCIQELQAAVGFPEYYAEEARYAVPAASAAPAAVPSSSGGGSSSGSGIAPSSVAAQAASEASGVEPDAVLEPGSSREPASDASSGTIDLYSGSGNGDSGRYGARDPADRRAQWLRVKVGVLPLRWAVGLTRGCPA